ncbi:MAG: DUF4345 domain-containing protein [Halioglobus sp.]
MRRVITRTALAGSGVTLGLIGGALMFAPRKFLQMSHVFVEPDPGLMSELTAPSGVLLITSALLLLGAVKLRFANLALLVGALVYGSYGAGRLVSMALHGVPSESLIAATTIELGIAVLLIAIWLSAGLLQRRDIDGTLFNRLVT